jgi:hypothetical protein
MQEECDSMDKKRALLKGIIWVCKKNALLWARREQFDTSP